MGKRLKNLYNMINLTTSECVLFDTHVIPHIVINKQKKHRQPIIYFYWFQIFYKYYNCKTVGQNLVILFEAINRISECQMHLFHRWRWYDVHHHYQWSFLITKHTSSLMMCPITISDPSSSLNIHLLWWCVASLSVILPHH